MECVGEVDGEDDWWCEVCSGVDQVDESVGIEVEGRVPVESLETVRGVVVIELVDGECAVDCEGSGCGCAGRDVDVTHLESCVACLGLSVGCDLCDGERSVEGDAGEVVDGQGGAIHDECCAVECSEVDVPSRECEVG